MSLVADRHGRVMAAAHLLRYYTRERGGQAVAITVWDRVSGHRGEGADHCRVELSGPGQPGFIANRNNAP